MNFKKLFASLCAVITMLLTVVSVCAEGEPSAQPAGGAADILSLIIPFALLAVVFYFFILRPQKKQQRETQQMRDSITRGDVVVTAGGIVGLVITVKDDMVLLESSGDKTKIQVQKWAISSIIEKAQ